MISKIKTVLDTLVLGGGSITALLVFVVSLDARSWAIETLGFAWIPVCTFLGVLLFLARYKHRLLFKYWRVMLVYAALSACSIGILSFIYSEYGVFSRVSFGGYWGRLVGGSNLLIGVFRLTLILLILPLILYPKKYGRYYISFSRRSAYAGWVFMKVSSKSLVFIWRHAYSVFSKILDARYRRRMLRRISRYLPVTSDRAYEFSVMENTGLGEIASGDDTTDQNNAVTAIHEGIPPLGDGSATNLSTKPVRMKSKWHLPSFSLLSTPEPYLAPKGSLEKMADEIENALADHSVIVEVKDIKAGPRIVRFGLVPGWVPRRGDSGSESERSRVKVQSILTREKDLALALKTPYLRIEAPVPGEALVGLEVPNPSPSKVLVRQVMDSAPFKSISNKGGLPIALGEDTGGNSVVTDLAALPHMLIAGATGSGKSVCINSIVASLLFTKPPDQLRVLMVDPKRVELTPFNGIPHLIAPVIVDVDQVNPALRAMMREMFLRYKMMEDMGTRNISGYNAKSKDKMPYLVLIVDELADLMMVGGFEIEQNLVRLAQLGRATGIHLVLATQRPSVNVVTGLLKANIPARVAFAVASQVDSRVILDTVGAEKLLGKGDMLLLNNDSPKARRVQGTLVYDEEVDRVVDFWINQKGPPLPEISLDDPDGGEPESDRLDGQMLVQARELAMSNPYLSSSVLERRLRIGGSKAMQIIETLEDEGLLIPR
ncbi:MAG: DNA translocase FtsK [Chloroflexota bacterium]|nr:DNA translocase FtsK [Chloroflexota bacterium]